MVSSKAQQLVSGSSLGPFRIERLLGAGGMARVYLAEDTKLARRVALKVLSPERSEDPLFRDRFLREARLAAELQHPNIVPIYDADEHDGLVYLVMAYVEGRSLGELVDQEGPLAPKRAVDIIEQVARALDVAHANGLVHRDVKPGNILIEADPPGRALLTDFGIALETSRAPAALTRRGEFFGTVAWVSPEQITGRPLDERTDIYSLGAVLFYTLTAEEPFARDTDAAVLYAHLSEPPPRVSDHVDWSEEPPSEGPPAVAKALDAVVEKALAKDPTERFRSAHDLAEAARQAAGTDAVEAAPLPGETAAPSAQKHAEPPPETSQPPPAGAAAVRLRLDSAFEYVHEPLESDQSAVPFLGNTIAIEALKERIHHSRGGAFLVTGFRGVGKTTIIKRALRDLRAEAGAETKVLHVSLNVARPLSTEALLFEVVRRLFEELYDRGVLASLPDEVQRAVILAYTRTSLSFKETRASATERARSLGVSLEALPMIGQIGPSVNFSRKQTDSLATEAAFLAYSDADVEHDFLRIVDLLRRDGAGSGAALPASRWLRLRRRLRGGPDPRQCPWEGRLIVVIDELDKLTATAEGVQALERILSGLKNLLSTRGVHFLFVAGPDLHDVALRESQRGSSVYESVFGWQLYVPCVWRAADELLGKIVRDQASTGEWYETLRDHLAFKARGIPRLLLLELNSFVRWDSEGPTIALDPVDARRITFYAELQRTLRDFMEPTERGGAAFAIPIDEDRWRLGAYDVVDWILRSRGRVFTVDELVSSAQDETPLDPNLILSEGKVRELLAHLIASGILERPDADRTLIGDAPSANVTTYRVVEDIYEKLGRFERWSERERSDPAAAAGAQPWADASSLGIVGDGRYELRRELGQSSLGTVYRAYDLRDGQEVAVKLLDTPGSSRTSGRRAGFGVRPTSRRPLATQTWSGRSTRSRTLQAGSGSCLRSSRGRRSRRCSAGGR